MRRFIATLILPALILPSYLLRSATPEKPIPDALSESSTTAEQHYYALADSAAIALNAEKYADAKQFLLKALRLQPANPSNPMLFSNLGICQAHLGEYTEALQSLEIALIKAPDSPKILLNRAKIFLLTEKYPEALTDLSSILSANPDLTDALLLRAPIYIKEGKFEEATADFSRLHSLLPEDTDITASLAECLAIKGDTEQADTLFQEAISNSDSVEIMRSAASFYLETNQLQKADDTIYQALKKYPRDGMLYLLRALLHRKRYQTTEAELDLKLAKEYNIDSQTIEKFFPKKAKK